jgi:hypothetical protein
MNQDTRLLLIANIEHLTGLLENCRMDARQAKATELLLAESWYRLADMD